MSVYTKIALIFILMSGLSCANKKGLVWEENFNGNTLNESVWNYELGDGCPELCGWGNNEKQIYTRKNHQVKDGFLHINIKKVDSTYTSTRITTKGNKEFKYGRIEARAKLPLAKGLWPAFWMLGSNISEVGWPLCGEIDILEYIGRKPNTIFTTLHFDEQYGENAYTKTTTINGIEDGFHIYAVHWSPDKIIFFVDDVKMFEYKPDHKTKKNWPFNQPFFIILNTAVGGNLGGDTIDDSIFPQKFIIDYIKVYEH
ncbi:family 16 glycosylhydrolase [Cellulophaga sp. L1A9]|uniref:glycoside hydrolase family 16 protein n=1 Tax=Cellulophaga sp. L1A9 TaxID=2686362 RepID=UPI00131BA2CD|nr:glycoside hydrolase family 16 protein [Cellulophaga sp. L1A9]